MLIGDPLVPESAYLLGTQEVFAQEKLDQFHFMHGLVSLNNTSCVNLKHPIYFFDLRDAYLGVTYSDVVRIHENGSSISGTRSNMSINSDTASSVDGEDSELTDSYRDGVASTYSEYLSHGGVPFVNSEDGGDSSSSINNRLHSL
jgi:hypothetical protein